MHRILERQLRHIFGSVNGRPHGLDDLLKVISDTYEHFDEDRALLDRSLELSSKEYFDNNKYIEEAKGNIEKLVAKRTQELHRQNETLVEAINSFSIGLAIFDLQNNVILANDALRRHLNISLSISSASCDEIIAALHGALDLSNILELQKGTRASAKIQYVTVGDKQLSIRFASIAIPQSSDSIVSVAMLVENITPS